MIEVLPNPVVVIILQHVTVSNQQVVHLKPTQSYMSIRNNKKKSYTHTQYLYWDQTPYHPSFSWIPIMPILHSFLFTFIPILGTPNLNHLPWLPLTIISISPSQKASWYLQLNLGPSRNKSSAPVWGPTSSQSGPDLQAAHLPGLKIQPSLELGCPYN